MISKGIEPVAIRIFLASISELAVFMLVGLFISAFSLIISSVARQKSFLFAASFRKIKNGLSKQNTTRKMNGCVLIVHGKRSVGNDKQI